MRYQAIEDYDGQEKIKQLIKLYKETKNENLKKDIFDLSIHKLDYILKHYSYKNADIINIRQLIIKYFFLALEEYIKMNNIKISFTNYIEYFISRKVKEEVRTTTNFTEIYKLLDLYYIYGEEEVKEKIISLYSIKIEYILKDYKSEQFSHEELYDVALNALNYSIETFNKVSSPSFYLYSLHNINKNLKQYIEEKSNKSELILEEIKC